MEEGEKMRAVCQYLARAMHEPKEYELTELLYRSVHALATDRLQGEYPVVFWREWGDSRGLVLVPRVGKQRYSLDPVHCTEARHRHVILVEGPLTYQGRKRRAVPPPDFIEDYLLFGIVRAARARATSIGVITHRANLSPAYIRKLRKGGMSWMLVSDSLDHGGYPRFVRPFPWMRERRIGPDPYPEQLLVSPRP